MHKLLSDDDIQYIIATNKGDQQLHWRKLTALALEVREYRHIYGPLGCEELDADVDAPPKATMRMEVTDPKEATSIAEVPEASALELMKAAHATDKPINPRKELVRKRLFEGDDEG